MLSHGSAGISRPEPPVVAGRSDGDPYVIGPIQEKSPADSGAPMPPKTSAGVDSDGGMEIEIDKNILPSKLSFLLEELKHQGNVRILELELLKRKYEELETSHEELKTTHHDAVNSLERENQRLARLLEGERTKCSMAEGRLREISLQNHSEWNTLEEHTHEQQGRTSGAKARQHGRRDHEVTESALRSEEVNPSNDNLRNDQGTHFGREKKHKELEHVEQDAENMQRLSKLEHLIGDMRNQVTTRQTEENIRSDKATVEKVGHQVAWAKEGVIESKRARREHILRPLSPNTPPLRQLSPRGNSALEGGQPNLNCPGANSSVVGHATAGRGERGFRRKAQEIAGHDATGAGSAGGTRDGYRLTRITRRAVDPQHSCPR